MMTDVQSSPLATDLDEIMVRTGDLWAGLRQQNLFLTGGTGFFGRWLLESFLRANEQFDLQASVTVLTRDPVAFRQKAPSLATHAAVRLHQGDARNFQFPTGRFTACIHAATEADSHVMASNPLQAFDVNVEGTRRVLDFARHAGVKRFLFTSSGAIYGSQPPDLKSISEDYCGGPNPIDAESLYGIPGEAKRTAESLCILYARQYGFECSIARCFTFVGPHLVLDGKFAIGNFLRDALSGGPIRVGGDGTPQRSYLYAADLTVWLWTILFRGVNGQAYNVGSDEAFSIRQIAETVAHHAGAGARVTVAQPPNPSRPTHRYIPNVNRARRELGLKIWTSLDLAVRRTLEFHQS